MISKSTSAEYELASSLEENDGDEKASKLFSGENSSSNREDPTKSYLKIGFLYVLFPLLLSLVILLIILLVRPLPNSSNSNSSDSNSNSDANAPSTQTTFVPISQYFATGVAVSSDDNLLPLFVRNHSGNTSHHLYGFIPWTLISGNKDKEDLTYLLYTEQLTSGVGLRDIFWDQGSIPTQVLVYLELDSLGSFTSGCNKKLLLKAPEIDYRDSSVSLTNKISPNRKNFAEGLLWSFDVEREDTSGVYVSMDDFALSPIGRSQRGEDLTSIIRKVYGSQAIYAVDKTVSTIRGRESQANSYSMWIESNLVYMLQPCSTAPAAIDDVLPLSNSLIVSVRRTLLHSEKFDAIHTCNCNCKHCKTSPSVSVELETKQSAVQVKALTTSSMSTTSSSKTMKNKKIYQTRPFHPKSGFNSISYMDDKQPLLGSRQKLYITRQHIALVNASSSCSKPLTPTRTRPQTVFVVSSDTPPVIRDAMLEGINWWDHAFQYAGHPAGTFSAVLQNKSDPNFDPYLFHSTPRTHFVEWINRDLRSYSYGARIADPSTGEILKGHVRIESLRLREDVFIAAAFLNPYSSFWNASDGDVINPDGSGCSCCYSGLKAALGEDSLQAVLQRVKVLAAHEVGHALGLAHNFAGSSYLGGFASVMDYPPPLIRLDDSGTKLVLNNASYANDIGFFDKVAINYGYREFPDSDTISESELRARLFSIIAAAEKQGYLFLTDQDADISSSDWRGTRFDNSNSDSVASSDYSPVRALNETLRVRNFALSQLDERALQDSAPLSRLRELFPMVYLSHRYEVEACAKLLGGVTYQYSLKGDPIGHRAVSVQAATQRAALQQLLSALSPSQLAISPNLQSLLGMPPAFGYAPDLGGSGDVMDSRMSAANFDVVASYETAANLVVSAVFESHRVERIAAQGFANDSSSQLLPGLLEVMETVSEAVFSIDTVRKFNTDNKAVELMAAQSVLINRYLSMAYNKGSGTCERFSSLVSSQAMFHLNQNVATLLHGLGITGLWRYEDPHRLQWYSHANYLTEKIADKKPFMSLPIPPQGSPI